MHKKNIEEIYYGKEPVFGVPGEMSLYRSLSWYSTQFGPKESKKYTIEYLKKNNFSKDVVEKLNSINDIWFKNLGFVCRIAQRGAIIKNDYINTKIYELYNVNVDIIEDEEEKSERTIQDRIYDQSSEYISYIEDVIDQFISTKTKISHNFYSWFVEKSVKSVHARQIIGHFAPLMDEINEVLQGKNVDLVEGYSNFTKPQLKYYKNLLENVIEDCSKIIDNLKITRKPRKKKVITVDKKISSLKYKKEDIEYKLVSIRPAEILGSKILWVFNTKYKKIGIYHANDDSGFDVKGTTLQNFDESRSIQKNLRKPLETLALFNKSSKSELRKFMNTIKCKESSLTGRINDEVILLKVIK